MNGNGHMMPQARSRSQERALGSHAHRTTAPLLWRQLARQAIDNMRGRPE